MAKQYKIVKSSDPKLVGVIFEYAIINDMAAPKWFTNFVETKFDPLVKRVEAIENRLETVIKLNNLKTE
ncbi:MAG: hypothetical protein LBS76_02475 [Mycoplasmataceae bacterium]|jgi:hypothetical protein|nr:hypothetical protein [Mycoplasmataceae bacterium]